jgi:hypothetical protein
MVESPLGTVAEYFMRFSIRDLLWLTVVVALACCWFMNDRSWRRYRDYRVAFAEKEAMRLLRANGELHSEIHSLLHKYGETEKLAERAHERKLNPVINADIPVPRLVP